MDMAEEIGTTTEEVFLYVDFRNKVRESAFQNKMFFRIVNLETETPLIQLNDNLFKGEYEDCMGTNLFFEDVEHPGPRCLFEGDSSIHLKHTVTQFKTLCLKTVKLPSKLKDIPQPEYDIKINTNYDYETLLKKLNDGSLNLEDDVKIVPKGMKGDISPAHELPQIIDNSENSDRTKPFSHEKQNCVEMQGVSQGQEEILEQSKPVSSEVPIGDLQEPDKKEIVVTSVDILKLKYEKLKKLSRRPVRRRVEHESICECDPKYQKAYEYNCMKSQIIRPSDYFPTIFKQFNKDTLEGSVDIDRSIIQGVIEPSTSYFRILTDEEKAVLLSMHNLENLSMPARYWVLKSQLDNFESMMLNMSYEELSKKDCHGRTIEETVGIYKRLLRVVNGIVEGNYHYDSEEETDDDSGDDDSIRAVDTTGEQPSLDIISESIDQDADKDAENSENETIFHQQSTMFIKSEKMN